MLYCPFFQLSCFYFRSVCRYNHYRKNIELEQMREYLAKRVLIEGTEMEKLYEAQVVEVGNKPTKHVKSEV